MKSNTLFCTQDHLTGSSFYDFEEKSINIIQMEKIFKIILLSEINSLTFEVEINRELSLNVNIHFYDLFLIAMAMVRCF